MSSTSKFSPCRREIKICTNPELRGSFLCCWKANWWLPCIFIWFDSKDKKLGQGKKRYNRRIRERQNFLQSKKIWLFVGTILNILTSIKMSLTKNNKQEDFSLGIYRHAMTVRQLPKNLLFLSIFQTFRELHNSIRIL